MPFTRVCHSEHGKRSSLGVLRATNGAHSGVSNEAREKLKYIRLIL